MRKEEQAAQGRGPDTMEDAGFIPRRRGEDAHLGLVREIDSLQVGRQDIIPC